MVWSPYSKFPCSLPRTKGMQTAPAKSWSSWYHTLSQPPDIRFVYTGVSPVQWMWLVYEYANFDWSILDKADCCNCVNLDGIDTSVRVWLVYSHMAGLPKTQNTYNPEPYVSYPHLRTYHQHMLMTVLWYGCLRSAITQTALTQTDASNVSACSESVVQHQW